MWHALGMSSRTSPDFAATAREMLLATSSKLILTAGSLYLAWHLIATVTWPERLGWRPWALAGLMLLVTFLPLRLLSRHASAALLLWQAGLAAAILAAVQLFQEGGFAWLFALLPLLAVVTLGWPAGLFVEGLVAVIVYWISTWALAQPLAWGAALAVIGGGALAGILGWAAEDTLLTVTQWSFSSSRSAQANMEQARQDRARVAVVLKDLDHAYHRLERANAALIAAWKAADEAERFKAEFVTNVSHELRTPLNLVIGFSEMMMTAPESYGGVPLPGPYRTDLNAIYHSARHLLALVDDVLDLGRIEAGKLALAREEVDLRSLVDEATEIVRNYIAAKGLELRLQLSEDLPPLWVDRLRIRQVLLNLLVNAARFSDRGWISIEASRQGEEVMVRVSDTGRGISEQDMPRIFEEFRSVDQPASTWHSGTGLGLPISKKFVELHRGRMGVESTYLQGTTFWFTLPCGQWVALPAPAPDRGRPELFARPGTTSPVIVVVHDHPHIAPLLQRYLDGYWVTGARSLQEGLALARESQAVAVVVDAAQAPADPPADIPLVRCPLPSGRQAATAIGAQDLLVKPVSRQELLAAVDRIPRPVNRILIADDDPDVVRMFRRMLETRIPVGSCTEAYNGEEALRLMRETKPDLVLLDLVMPEVDGQTVLERMAADPELARTPVVIVSAKVQDFANMKLPGAIQISQPGGFRLGEVVRGLEAILKVLSPGWPPAAPRAQEPPEAPVETPVSTGRPLPQATMPAEPL